MASELGQAYVQIIPSAKGISGAISKELGGAAEPAGKSAGGRLGGAIKGALATAGIGAALSKTLGEGADLEQSVGGIETLFKDSAGKMKEYASQAYQTAGVSANTYMETVTSFSASLLQSLGGDTAKAADTANMAMVDMSDNANKMGTNMEDIQNAYQGFAKQNYTMLDNLKLGYGGTKKEMERLLSDAEKFSGQKYDISNLNDVYSAIHVIQGELDITGTTAKEASTTLAGSFGAMKAAFSDFLGNLTLGNDIKPSLQALVQTASTYLFDNLLPAVGNIIGGLPGAIGTLLETGIPKLIQYGGKLIRGLVGGLQAGAPQLLTAFSDAVSRGVEWLRTSFPQLLTAGSQRVMNLASGFTQNLPSLIASLGGILQQLLQALMDAAPQMLNAASRLISQLSTAFSQNLPGILSSLAKVLGQLVVTVLKNAPKILVAAVKLALALASGIGKSAGAVLRAIGSLLASLGSKVLSYGAKMLSAGGQLIGNLASGVRKTASKALSAAKEVAGKLLSPITDAKDKIKGVVDKIKGFFSGLKLKIPKFSLPQMPKFGLNWSTKTVFGKEFKYPSGISVTWHREGGIFTGPTLLHGVGEAGAEAVLPLTALWSKFSEMADSIVNGVGLQLAAAGAGNAGPVHLTLYLWPSGPKAGEWVVNTYDEYKRKKG